MYKIKKTNSIFNEEFDFNLDLHSESQKPINQLDWPSLIPYITSIDENLSSQLTQALNEFCRILADPTFIESINSIFNQPNSTDYEIQQLN